MLCNLLKFDVATKTQCGHIVHVAHYQLMLCVPT